MHASFLGIGTAHALLFCAIVPCCMGFWSLYRAMFQYSPTSSSSSRSKCEYPSSDKAYRRTVKLGEEDVKDARNEALG